MVVAIMAAYVVATTYVMDESFKLNR